MKFNLLVLLTALSLPACSNSLDDVTSAPDGNKELLGLGPARVLGAIVSGNREWIECGDDMPVVDPATTVAGGPTLTDPLTVTGVLIWNADCDIAGGPCTLRVRTLPQSQKEGPPIDLVALPADQPEAAVLAGIFPTVSANRKVGAMIANVDDEGQRGVAVGFGVAAMECAGTGSAQRPYRQKVLSFAPTGTPARVGDYDIELVDPAAPCELHDRF